MKMVVVTLLSTILIATDHHLQKSHQIRQWLETSLYPLHQLIDFPSSLSIWIADETTSSESLQEENASLRKKNLLLQHKLQKYEAVEAENSRLRELLDSSFIFGEIHRNDRVRLAEIISVDLDAFNKEIILNKGGDDKVYIGQPLMDASGVMGQIVRVTPTSSTALLISSSRHSIPVQNRRNGIRSIAIGLDQSNQLKLRFLPAGSDLRPGDTLITSGLGGKFPYGYPVGTIKSISHPEGEPFAEALLTPTASLERSREVLLIWPSKRSGNIE